MARRNRQRASDDQTENETVADETIVENEETVEAEQPRQFIHADREAGDEVPAPAAAPARLRRDPRESIGSCLVSLGEIHNLAEETSAGITAWLGASAADPELHAFLSRMQALLGEFRHAMINIEDGISDRLRDAIENAVS